jgi:hypothetical protein
MQQVKHTIITDWLYQYGDSKIDKKVQKYLETKKRTMEQVKQTAIDWFEYQLKDNLGNIVINQNWQLLEGLIQQAKEMEKEQIENAYNNGDNRSAELYYNETYKSE